MKAREQRIKLKMLHNPVKLDATIVRMEPDGSKITVTFDQASMGTIDLFPYGREGTVLTDKKTTSAMTDNARIFEVL